MIVNEHLAALSEAGQGEHTLDVPARGDACGAYDALLIDGADETHFPPAREPNGGTHRGSGR